ncbi:MAG: pirin family protein [Planctomycetaceae bacterium]|nr:pirin family protein [Planctomycetaceae bacterium]
MITLRKSADRGHADYGWLDTHYTFSFADYYDPAHMGFRGLRVINEDIVAPGGGFPTHGHRDMEIVTYVLSGAIEHKDSLGSGEVLRPGELQRMSAGRGVQHSEFNPSRTDPLHLLQIWILPERSGTNPEYEQKPIPETERRNKLGLLATREPTGSALTIHADATIYGSLLDKDKTVTHELAPGRHAWLQLARGKVRLNGLELSAGDGASATAERKLEITALEPSEFLLFDLK